MVVHDVEVDDVGAAGNHIANLFTQAGEVGGQDARGDTESSHGWSAVKKDALFYAAVRTVSECLD
jgi:hypothetical protein